jgi:hypothetical protein
MTIAEWLEQGMDEKKIGTQGELAELAGVSPSTISNGKKRGSFRSDSMLKLEEVLGPYPGEESQLNKQSLEDWLKEVETTLEASLKRFKGKSCPTPTKLCRACWSTLRDANTALPQTRAMCRLAHGWVQQGGLLFFQEEEGVLVREEDL